MSTEILPPCPLGLTPETVAAWHDGALNGPEAARIGAHVAGCPTCGARLADIDAVERLVRSEHTPEPDARLWESVRARRAAGRRSGQLWKRRRPILGGLGAVAAVVLLTLGFAHLLGSFGRLPSGEQTPVVPPATASAPLQAPTAAATASAPVLAPSAVPTLPSPANCADVTPGPGSLSSFPLPPGTVSSGPNGAAGAGYWIECTPSATQPSIVAYLNNALPQAGWRPWNPQTDNANGCGTQANDYWKWTNGTDAVGYNFSVFALPRWSITFCNLAYGRQP